MEPIIDVRHLGKLYRTAKRGAGLGSALRTLVRKEVVENAALKDVSFTVAPGEIVGLIGPNGAGKSTLIKTLSGVLHPTSGTVKVMGYTPWEDRSRYVRHIGVVFGQKEQLWWDLPAIDSFHLNRDLYGIGDGFEARLARMVELLQLGPIIHTPIRDLSLGERMKCKLVAALLHEPQLVFLDEPSIGLDVVAKDILRDFILEVNRERGTTILVTTHDMQDIERLCQRILIINFGDIIYDGPLSTIKRRYLNTKIIDVLFETEAPSFELAGCAVVECGKYNLKLRADMTRVSVKSVVAHIMAHYEFADLIINDPPIEEIIARIYKENGRVMPGAGAPATSRLPGQPEPLAPAVLPKGGP